MSMSKREEKEPVVEYQKYPLPEGYQGPRCGCCDSTNVKYEHADDSDEIRYTCFKCGYLTTK